MATLHIRLLGDFRLEQDAGGGILLSSRMGTLLLARLAVPPGTAHHREGLQLLLWPEADRKHAQGNLRYLLHKLRRTLPTACARALVCTHGQVSLDAGLVAVDAERFERLVREDTAEALAAACALYSGDLLAELPLHAPEFEDWLLPERARFRELARDAFWRHFQSAVWRGDVATAMRDGRRYLDIDPYCERMHQALIRLHLARGERALAARLYLRLKETLARDLQVEPGPEIAALVRRTIWNPGPARVPGRLDPAWVLGRDEVATTGAGTSLVAISTKPSIAVLPFEYRGGDPKPEYVADGLTEDIITDLSRFRSLFVTAGKSSSDGGGVDAKAIARDLGVRYVFEGTVRESAAVMRITGRLIDAATGGQIWAARYDRTLDEVLEHQDEISSGFVGNIAAQITANEVNRVKRLGPGHLRADDLGLRAYDRALFAVHNHCEGARQEIMTLARQAISMDPGCRMGYAAIAEFHLLEALFAWTRSENDSLAKAQEAAEQIRIHDPGDHSAHLLLGRVALLRKQHDVALWNLRNAVDLNPNDMRALCCLAWAEASSGRPDLAQDHAESALRLGPQNPDARHFAFWNLAHVAFTTGDYLAGAMYAQQAHQEMPRHVGDLGMLAACLAESGEATQARAAIDEAMRLGPRYIKDRLRGNSYFKSDKDHDRFVGALRRAAGDLQF